MIPTQLTQTNLPNEEDNMNQSEITYRVDQLMDLGNARS